MWSQQRDGGINPLEWADLYVRVSQTGEDRYHVDWWTAQGEWHGEGTMPQSVRDYLREALNRPYFEPECHQLLETAGPLLMELVPEGVWQSASVATLFRIRLELRGPSLPYLPWEYLAFSHLLALSSQAYPARLVLPQFDVRSLPVNLPLRVLYVSANPSRSKAAVDLSAELHHFEWAIQQTAGASVSVDSLLGADLETLRQKLASSGSWYHILHFVGHGFNSPSGPMIALETDRRSQFVSPTELGDLLRSGGVRLLTLQTPVSTPNYHLAALAGFSAQVRALGVPAVLHSLSRDVEEIPDVTHIYAGLARGMPVDAACGEAYRVFSDKAPIMALTLHTQNPDLFQLRVAETGDEPGFAAEHPDSTETIEIDSTKDTTRRRLDSGSVKQILQQIDLVQGKIQHLERMQATYQQTSSASWLDQELSSQQEQLSELLGELDEEA